MTTSPTKSPDRANRYRGQAPGLFVIWETGREFQQSILEDLAQNFRITSVYEIEWQPHLVWANFQRFYSDLQVRGVYHESNKGRGRFLAITLLDRNPRYARRETMRGLRTVNANFFDAKKKYREWTGSLGIHCGENDAETHRDIAMLLGTERIPCHTSIDWDGEIERLQRDISGADSWTSLSEVFDVLSASVQYVVVDYDVLLSPSGPRGSRALDILTSDYASTCTILSTGPVVPRPPQFGAMRTLRISGETWSVTVRHPGDGYLHPDWARHVLATRNFDEAGIPRPATREAIWLLMRFYATEARTVPEPVRQVIAVAGLEQGIPNLPDKSLNDRDFRSALAQCLHASIAEIALADSTNDDRAERLARSDQPCTGLFYVLRRRRFRTLLQRLNSWSATRYYLARDTLIHRFPALRDLWHRQKTKRLGNEPPA